MTIQKRRSSGAAPAMVFAFSFALATASWAAAPLRVYVAPSTAVPAGNDANAGTSAGAPVLTLVRAQQVATATFNANPANYTAVDVSIAPGVYLGQDVVWSFIPSTHVPVVIHGAVQTNKPVFDGDGVKASFLRVASTTGPTNITLRDLRIRRYLTSAVQLRGHTTDWSKFNSGTLVERVIFEKIGNAFVFPTSPAYAALSLINTRDNIIRDCIFSEVGDVNPSTTGLHAIYAAHGATGNLIERNVFENITAGQVVKFRNRSDGNAVLNNAFINNRNWSAVYNWYSRTGGPECPNYELVVDGNRVVMGSGSPQPPPPEPKSGPEYAATFAFNASKALLTDWPFSTAAPYLCPASVWPELAGRTRTVVGENFTQGCFVSVEKCPRMKRDDFFEFSDTVFAAHGSSSACQARARDWYSSCSRDTPGTPQLAKTRFLGQTAQVGEAIMAHGCVITASSCSQMGFVANQSKLDTRAEAHTSQTTCLARATTYKASCTNGLSSTDAAKVTVRAQFFQNGTLLATHTR